VGHLTLIGGEKNLRAGKGDKAAWPLSYERATGSGGKRRWGGLLIAPCLARRLGRGYQRVLPSHSALGKLTGATGRDVNIKRLGGRGKNRLGGRMSWGG